MNYRRLCSLSTLTKNTILNVTDFRDELESVREKGYSVDLAEEIDNCHCIGVPVFYNSAQVIAALWTTGLSTNFPLRIFDKIANILKESSKEISKRLSSNQRSHSEEYINSVIERAIELMENHSEKKLDMKELAEKLYVGYSWFRKNFKEKTGLSPNQYHMNLRLEKEEELLISTDLNITKIADKTGFEYHNNLSALFKKKRGMSPQDYRNIFSK